MRNTVIWSFFSIVALASGGLISGCDSDDALAKSALGESCDKTSDCADGLKCIEGACYQSASSGGSSNEGGEGSGGTTVVGPKPPVLGGEGESCAKRADCEDGLGCFNERCTKSAGEGGEGNIPGVVLGVEGETCTTTTDCGKGLGCRPGGYMPGAGFTGVCTKLDTGLEPTGKTCGYECAEAADCCELPVILHATLGAFSCSDLATLVADVPNCATATALNGQRCLAYDVYCDENCGNSTWSCEAGTCAYEGECSKAGAVIGGCPSYTRGGNGIPACDIDAGTCTTEVVDPMGCTDDESCFDPTPMAIVGGGGDLCSEGECTCHAGDGGCYRKCSENADCPVGYHCDEETTLCMPQGMCSTDAQCIEDVGDARVKCVDGTCTQPPCENDLDCNLGGFVNGYFENVCGPDKTCVPLGCTDDTECPAYSGVNGLGVRSFCATFTGVAGVGAPVSAITD